MLNKVPRFDLTMNRSNNEGMNRNKNKSYNVCFSFIDPDVGSELYS
jgi:hypothetical protein